MWVITLEIFRIPIYFKNVFNLKHKCFIYCLKNMRTFKIFISSEFKKKKKSFNLLPLK